MQSLTTRQLGRTGQESTVLTFGAIALDYLSQEAATDMVDEVVNRGVNHVDVAPGYRTAEVKLGPGLREHRDELFLGCKTQERTKEGARAELERSLERMGVDHIDLYQFHGVTDEAELDTITGPDGALEAFREARDEGLIDHIGVTSHSTPAVILDAIERIEPDTVMFPVNFTALGKTGIDPTYHDVLTRARDEEIGVIAIKAFAKEPWPTEAELPRDERPYETWYRPYDTQSEIDDCLNFALSQDVTTITNAGDPRLVPMILDAAERFEELDDDERTRLLDRGRGTASPVPADLRGETPKYLHPGVDE